MIPARLALQRPAGLLRPVRLTTAAARVVRWLQRGVVLLLAGCAAASRPTGGGAGAPPLVLGEFRDDYDGGFTISDSVWLQQPRNRFRVVAWHEAQQYLIAHNSSDSPTAPNRWTRIDWMVLDGMPPYTWAFCLTAYQAPTRKDAEATPAADRATPKTGCNGYPFSRMQRSAVTDSATREK